MVLSFNDSTSLAVLRGKMVVGGSPQETLLDLGLMKFYIRQESLFATDPEKCAPTTEILTKPITFMPYGGGLTSSTLSTLLL